MKLKYKKKKKNAFRIHLTKEEARSMVHLMNRVDYHPSMHTVNDVRLARMFLEEVDK